MALTLRNRSSFHLSRPITKLLLPTHFSVFSMANYWILVESTTFHNQNVLFLIKKNRKEGYLYPKTYFPLQKLPHGDQQITNTYRPLWILQLNGFLIPKNLINFIQFLNCLLSILFTSKTSFVPNSISKY